MDAKLYVNGSRTASHIISNSPQRNIRALCIDIDGLLKIDLSEKTELLYDYWLSITSQSYALNSQCSILSFFVSVVDVRKNVNSNIALVLLEFPSIFMIGQ